MRTGDVYGRVVTRFIDQALRGVPLTVFGDGLQIRSFTYVSDMVRGIFKVAFHSDLSGEVINLGSRREMKIIELAKIIIEMTNSNSNIEFHPLPPDDPKRRCPDTSKAEQLLAWKAETDLKEGLYKSISWLKEQQSKKKYFDENFNAFSNI